jgi:hypothetical protein
MNSEHAVPVPSEPGHGHGHGHVPEPGYETRDANIWGLLRFAGGLIVVLVVVHLVMLAFQYLFVTERPESPEQRAEARSILPGPPQEQEQTQARVNIYQQLRKLHRDEEAMLSRYGWVDRKAGVVRIPIDRAIDVVAEQGVRFGKGPKTEIEMNSHAGTPVPLPPAEAEKDAKKPPEGTERKP